MYNYILFLGILTVIWVVNGRMIIKSAKENITGEVYNHTGLGIFFTLMTLELILGKTGMWTQANILYLQIIGYILYIPSIFLVFGAIIQLKHIGKAKSLAPHGANNLVQIGIYGIIRHPMWLGMVIWSVALVFIFQSVLSIILSSIAIVCFGIGSIKEDEFNLKEFGDPYREYMKKVPMWNFLNGLRK